MYTLLKKHLILLISITSIFWSLTSFSNPISNLECDGIFKQGGLLICKGEPNEHFYIMEYNTLPSPLLLNQTQWFEKQKLSDLLSKDTNLETIKTSKNGIVIIGLHKTAPQYLVIIHKMNIAQSKNQSSQSGFNTLSTKTYHIQPRQYKIEKINGLPAHKVTPKTAQQIEKIKQDSILKKKGFSHYAQKDYFLDGFIIPAKGRISGIYGSQRILNGTPKNPHYGLDIAAQKGSPVIAPASGIVTLANPDLYYEGGLILIDHGQGLISAFLHLNTLDVKKGDYIKKGEKIGSIGATGRATGPHLDWRVKWKKRQIDPEFLLKMQPVFTSKQKKQPK